MQSHAWATELSVEENRRRGVDWRRYAISFGQRGFDPTLAAIVDRTLALGCVQGLRNANLEHMGASLYHDMATALALQTDATEID